MAKLTEEVQFTAGNRPTLTMSESGHHSRMGNAVHRWADDLVIPAATASVVAEDDSEYDLSDGEQVFVTGLDVAVLTASKNAHFNMVRCSAATGGGTATDIQGHLHVFSSANLAGTENKMIRYDPPIRVRYSDGNRSIAVRVHPSDASVTLGFSWQGWVEDE